MTSRYTDTLTPREQEVIELLSNGLTNEEIARQLGISLDGVKYHVSGIFRRLRVTNRHEAASLHLGTESGVLTPREQEVIALLAAGLTNEEIARQLGISVDGVKYHVSGILRRLDVESRHEAASLHLRTESNGRLAAWAPVMFLRKLPFGLLPNVGAAAVLAIAAGAIAVFVWALISTHTVAEPTTRCGAGQSDGSAPDCAPGVAPAGGVGSGVTAIDATVSCALKDGGVWCWGSNSALNSNTSVPYAVPGLNTGISGISGGACVLKDGGLWCWDQPAVNGIAPVPGLENGVTAVSSGNALTCALKDGGVFCFDRDAGEGVPAAWNPITFDGLTGGVTAVSVGGERACAVKDGDVWCWSGSQVDGSLNSADSPALVPGLANGVIAISAGTGHACALRSNGVWCWGDNGFGQLGTDNTTGDCSADHPKCSDVAVPVSGLGDGVSAISVGGNNSCALKDGAVWCWGEGDMGQLGNNDTADSAVPMAVYGLSGVTAISTGGDHSCAVKDVGVWCWGGNALGQLGDRRPTGSSVPVAVSGMTSGVSAILVASGSRTCALKDERVWCWGDNHYGELGNNSTADSPVAVPMAGIVGNVSTISEGDGHSCALVDGGVWCWGKMGLGFAGSDTTADSLVPVPVSGLTEGVSAITVGGNDNCALKGGGVWCWGSGYNGELGNGGRKDSAVPVPVAGMEDGVTAIQAHGATTCALKDNGVWCWGAGAGEFAGASTTESLLPVVIPGLESGVSAISGSCILKDPDWWCGGPAWKFDRTGDRSVNRPVAAPIAGLNGDVSAIIEPGIEYACVIKEGGLWCRIAGTFAEVPGFESGVTAISEVRGFNSTGNSLCALKDGGVWCWGGNFFMNIETARPAPVVMPGLESGVSQLNGNCALKGGGVWCWGGNEHGQLGNGSPPYSLVPVQVQIP